MVDQSEPRLLDGSGLNPLNPFLDIESHKKDRYTPRRLYAHVESSESHYRNQIIKLSAVDADWFDHRIHKFTRNGSYNESSFLAEAELWVIELRLPPAIADRSFEPFSFLWIDRAGATADNPATQRQALIEATRRGWWHIELAERLTSHASYDVQLYHNLFAQPRSVTLVGMQRIENAYLKALLDIGNPLDGVRPATAQQVAEAFKSLSGQRGAEIVAVYDVGQGSCAGILISGEPHLYVDFGGGVLGNSGTFPSGMTRFCFSKNPNIVLSHWDWDHWSSAYRDRRALASNWLVPRQGTLGHVHRAFIADVFAAGGDFLAVPSAPPLTPLPWLMLERGTGKSRNGSGIAVTIYPPTGQTGNPILLPGDAGLTQIRSVSAGAIFDSLVCSHHGGRMHSRYVPNCPGAAHSRLAYSFGPGNTYMHALRGTREHHHAAGWTDAALDATRPHIVRETAERQNGQLGHIAISWSGIPTPMATPCGGLCSLDLRQS